MALDRTRNVAERDVIADCYIASDDNISAHSKGCPVSLLSRENVTNEPLTHGDAGIVLKEDGTFRVFNLHQNIDPANVTPAQKAQMKKLLALAVALKVPQVMDVLYECAADPAIVGETLNLGALQ